MNKSVIALLITSLATTAYAANEDTSVSGYNGVSIELTGTFYEPNESQMLQETTPVFEFDGLNERGGSQIVQQYKQTFGEDIMGLTIKAKLSELDERLDEERIESILLTMEEFQANFPNVMSFYRGVASETGHSLSEVYLAAWANDGMFAINIQELVKVALPALKDATNPDKLKEITDQQRGCSVIAFDNGVAGQNQDMPIAMGGWGAIWKSEEVIVHAAEPLFTAMAMGQDITSNVNTVDTFNEAWMEYGLPSSGVALGIAATHDSAHDAAKTLSETKMNAALALTYTDKHGGAVSVEVQKGADVVHDGSRNGFVTHTNHPIGLEDNLVDRYANGNAAAFDSAVKTTLWRQEAAQLVGKFAPSKDVTALKDTFKQKPFMKAPYEGNDFVSVNTVIHDLNEGCSYGTTWLSTLQDFTKVCFDK